MWDGFGFGLVRNLKSAVALLFAIDRAVEFIVVKTAMMDAEAEAEGDAWRLLIELWYFVTLLYQLWNRSDKKIFGLMSTIS